MTEEDIRRQWAEFSKTAAFEQLMEYIELTKNMLIIQATGPMFIPLDVNTNDVNKTTDIAFDAEKSAYLLQRSVGCDIIKQYISELTDVQKSQN